MDPPIGAFSRMCVDGTTRSQAAIGSVTQGDPYRRLSDRLRHLGGTPQPVRRRHPTE